MLILSQLTAYNVNKVRLHAALPAVKHCCLKRERESINTLKSFDRLIVAQKEDLYQHGDNTKTTWKSFRPQNEYSL